MIALPYELIAAHMVYDDSESQEPSPYTRALGPTRYLASVRSAAREAQRASVRRRFRAGWAVLNPDVAPALRRGR